MADFSVLNYWRSYRHFKVVAVILIIIGLAWTSEGLRICYHCNTSTSGLECAYNPSNVTDGEIKCKGYCTIRRKEYANMPEDASLIEVLRTCEVDPRYYDEVVVESYFKVYFRSCRSYLCNRGSGRESLREMPVDPNWDSYTDNDSDANGALNRKPVTIIIYNILSLSVVNISLLFLLPYM